MYFLVAEIETKIVINQLAVDINFSLETLTTVFYTEGAIDEKSQVVPH